jgi:hypothetical protein
MSAPAPSFKSELAIYRRQLLESENKDQPWLPAALRVLDRWKDHPDVETAWETIKQKLPPAAAVTPGQFIDLFLQRWDAAFHLDEAIRDGPAVERRVRATATRHWRDGDWDNAAGKMKEADVFRRLGQKVLGRKKRGEPSRRFMSGWQDAFKNLCGQPLTDVVCTLTEVAFGGTVPAGKVRDSQKPTTKSKRDIRGLK